MRSVRQRLIEKFVYPLDAHRRGSDELRILRELLQSERASSEELHAQRLARLRAMLAHAGEHVPFYRRRFADSGFSPHSVRDFGDLTKLPLLSKSDIQEHRSDLISTAFRREELIENRTGGSTGSPLVFYHHKDRIASRQAATIRHNLWAGYRIGSKAAVLWGHQLDLSGFDSRKAQLRNWLLDRQMFLDASSLSDERMSLFATRLRAFRPEVILAYANSLALFVDYCREQKLELPPVKSVITSAEVLTREARKSIEEFFGVRVFDRYGSRETSVIASECEAHDGMHINAEYLHLEFLEDAATDSLPGQGEIIVTSLANLAFPFIRYRIGDMGIAAPPGCVCGRTLPKMQMVAGRVTDFLMAPDGRKVSGAAMTIYLAARVPGIRQAQLVQREPLRIVFNLVVGPEFNDTSRELVRRKVDHFFGAEMGIEFNFVAGIPREASGKYRFSICELATVGKSH